MTVGYREDIWDALQRVEADHDAVVALPAPAPHDTRRPNAQKQADARNRTLIYVRARSMGFKVSVKQTVAEAGPAYEVR